MWDRQRFRGSGPKPPPESSAPGLPANNQNNQSPKSFDFLDVSTGMPRVGESTSRALDTGKATVSDSARAGAGGSGDTSPANPVSDTTAAAASPAAACRTDRPQCSGSEARTAGGCSRLSDRTRSLALPARTAGVGVGLRTRRGSWRGAAAREQSTISMGAVRENCELRSLRARRI